MYLCIIKRCNISASSCEFIDKRALYVFMLHNLEHSKSVIFIWLQWNAKLLTNCGFSRLIYFCGIILILMKWLWSNKCGFLRKYKRYYVYSCWKQLLCKLHDIDIINYIFQKISSYENIDHVVWFLKQLLQNMNK